MNRKIKKLKEELDFYQDHAQSPKSEQWWKNMVLLMAEILIDMEES